MAVKKINQSRFFGELTQSEAGIIPFLQIGDMFFNEQNNLIVKSDQKLKEIKASSVGGNTVEITDIEDFPQPTAGGVILLENKNYIINNPNLVTNYRFVCTAPCFIGGFSSETSKLVRIVDDGEAFITATDTLDLGDITFTAPLALGLDGTGKANAAADWLGVNFLDCAEVGTIRSFSNFIGFANALLNSQGLRFTGNIDTVAFDTTIFSNLGNGTAVIFDENLTINRRIRIQFSAFVATGLGKSIDVSLLANIPSDSYILFRNNFAGGGQYINGVQPDDNKSDFESNKGINNSGSSITFFVDTPQSPTAIDNTNDFFDLNIAWLDGSVKQRFELIGNSIRYIGSITTLFEIFANISLVSGNNNQIELEISKNGVPIAASKSTSTTSGTGRSENIPVSTIEELKTNDVITFSSRNATSLTNVTVVSANGRIKKA